MAASSEHTLVPRKLLKIANECITEPDISHETKAHAFDQILAFLLEMPKEHMGNCSANLDNDLSLVMDALRVTCRDLELSGKIAGNADALEKLYYFGALAPIALSNSDDDDLSSHPQHRQVSNAALKTLINVLYHHASARVAFASSTAAKILLDRLLCSTNVDKQSETLYLWLRLAFLGTIETAGVQLAYDNSLLKAITETYFPLYMDWQKTEANSMAMNQFVEILRLLYNITRTKEHGTSHDLAEKLVRALLECASQPDMPLNIRGQIFSILFNLIPSGNCVKQLDVIDNAGNGMLLRNLSDALNPLSKEYISPIMCTLDALCKAHDSTRRFLRKAVLPSKIDRTKKPEEGDSLKARIVRLLGHTSQQICRPAGDLLFTLCKKNVSRFVFHVGYGNAAGFLYSQNLLTALDSGSHASNARADGDEAAALSSDEEMMSKAPADFDATTGARLGHHSGLPQPAGTGMTEEEKEQESLRLLDLFEKLERNGVIKLMGPNQGGAP